MTKSLLVPFLLVSLTLVSGCSKEDLAKAKENASKAIKKASKTVGKQLGKAQKKISDTVDKAKQDLNLAGSMELSIGSPLSIKGCYARLTTFPSGRGNVLQLASYSDSSRERFPAAFFHAEIQASQLTELSGKTISGRLFVQPDKDSSTWYTVDSAPVQLKVTSADTKSIAIDIVGGTMRSTKSEQDMPVSGSMNAVVSND